MYKKKLTLFKTHSDPSKAGCGVTVPSKAFEVLGWNKDKLLNKKDAIICVATPGNLFYYTLEEHDDLPSQRLNRRHKLLEERYNDIMKLDPKAHVFNINWAIKQADLPFLMGQLPSLKEDIDELRGDIEILENILNDRKRVEQKIGEAKRLLEVREHAYVKTKKRIEELKEQLMEAKSSKKALKKGTK